MSIPLNSSGMPKGTGSLQVRGRVYWAIFTDVSGRRIQINTEQVDLADARRVLAHAAIPVLQARLAALEEVAGEGHHQPRAAARAARGQGTYRPAAKADARGRKANTQGGSR